jgi:hypothetical protein
MILERLEATLCINMLKLMMMLMSIRLVFGDHTLEQVYSSRIDAMGMPILSYFLDLDRGMV